MRNHFLIVSIFIFLINSSFVNSNINKPYHLFKIERSKDANEIFYDINLTQKNELNSENPINIYWIRATEGGSIKPLTWIQQHYAYGLNFIYHSNTFAKFHFVSYKKRDFVLKKNKDGVFKVFTQINDKEMEVNRIFIQIDGGTFWVPKISKVELHTFDPITQKSKIEIINP